MPRWGSYSHTPKVFTSVLPPVAKTFKITLDSFALSFFFLFLYVFFTRLPRLPVLSRASKLVHPGTKGSKSGASSCCLGSVPGRCFHSVYSKKAYSYLKRHGNWYRLAHVTPPSPPPLAVQVPCISNTFDPNHGTSSDRPRSNRKLDSLCRSRKSCGKCPSFQNALPCTTLEVFFFSSFFLSCLSRPQSILCDSLSPVVGSSCSAGRRDSTYFFLSSRHVFFS